jgi:hypothetical protein
MIPWMTREDATERATALNAEHPERGRYRWMVQETESDWQVVRIAVPGAVRIDPLTTTVESGARPQPAEDPRPLFDKNVGGPWVGGV